MVYMYHVIMIDFIMVHTLYVYYKQCKYTDM